MARRIERLAVSVIAERDEDGTQTFRFSSIGFTVVETNPASSNLVDTAPLNGRIPGPAFDGSLTVNQLLQACQNLVKAQGNVP